MSAYAVRCVASPTMAPDVAHNALRAPRGAAVGVSKAHTGIEEEPRERLACVDAVTLWTR